jgi:hypothetical protein
MSKLLHKAIGLGGNGASGQAAYDAYTQHFKEAPVHVLRDMLELDSGRAAIPVEQVEPAADIMSRFCTGGMSLGAISRETHETIAIAINRIGGKSNSGERRGGGVAGVAHGAGAWGLERWHPPSFSMNVARGSVPPLVVSPGSRPTATP